MTVRLDPSIPTTTPKSIEGCWPNQIYSILPKRVGASQRLTPIPNTSCSKAKVLDRRRMRASGTQLTDSANLRTGLTVIGVGNQSSPFIPSHFHNLQSGFEHSTFLISLQPEGAPCFVTFLSLSFVPAALFVSAELVLRTFAPSPAVGIVIAPSLTIPMLTDNPSLLLHSLLLSVGDEKNKEHDWQSTRHSQSDNDVE